MISLHTAIKCVAILVRWLFAPSARVQGKSLRCGAMHGRGVVQLMTNTAMNGVCHRADGGTIRSIFG